MVAAVLVRLPFISTHLFQSDPMNYAWGALVSGVAHPPGYSGYCFLAWLVNLKVHDINKSLVTINFVAGLLSIPVIHMIAQELGLSARACLMAAAGYTFSVNSLWATTCAVNHACEGLGAATFALLALRACNQRSWGNALAASVVLAAFGALRPTTSYFLVPLWMFMLIRSCRWNGIGLAVNIVAFASVCFAWHRANETLMAQAGYGGTTFAVQAMMPAGHEYASLTITPLAKEWSASFHMPMVEVAAWIEDQLGIYVLTRSPELPPPRIARACTLAAVQGLKLGYYILFSAPMIIAAAWAAALQTAGRVTRETLIFFGLWIMPASLFFVIGHLGAFGYIEVILPAIFLLSVVLVDGRQAIPNSARVSNRAFATAAVTVVAGLLFFALGRPTYARSGIGQAADLLALQYTGAAIRAGYAISRATIHNDDPRQVPLVIREAKTDEELIAVFKAINFTATPVLHSPPADSPD